MEQERKGLAARRRRRHSDEFKAEAVAAAQVPGVSVSAVALERGINANLLRRWCELAGVEPNRQRAPRQTLAAVQPLTQPPLAFVPASVAPAPAAPAGAPPAASSIRVEIQRGSASIAIHWPASSASECAVWLREWLR